MVERSVDVCPFLVNTEIVHEGENIKTISKFGACMKDECPAFREARNGYGDVIEKCIRIE